LRIALIVDWGIALIVDWIAHCRCGSRLRIVLTQNQQSAINNLNQQSQSTISNLNPQSSITKSATNNLQF